MYGGSRLLRRVLATKLCPSSIKTLSSSLSDTPFATFNSSSLLPSSTSVPPSFPYSTYLNSALSYASNFRFQTPSFQLYRHISSSSPGESKTVLIKSEEEFNTSISKVHDESLPAIFYFRAVWCGPCRFIAPIIEELSKNHPQVTIYKIDIDQDGLENTLSKLNIGSVPTLHFFHEGKKAAEVIGADVERIKQTTQKLYQ